MLYRHFRSSLLALPVALCLPAPRDGAIFQLRRVPLVGRVRGRVLRVVADVFLAVVPCAHAYGLNSIGIYGFVGVFYGVVPHPVRLCADLCVHGLLRC